MKTTKRIVSVLLCIIMLFSVTAVGFSSAAEEIEYCSVPDCAGICEWRVESVYGCQENRGLICKVCGNKKYGETVYNHSYQRYAYVAPTCVKEGAEYLYCINEDCYETKVDVIPIDVNAHSYDDWTVTKEATCNKTGLRVAYCVNESAEGTPCGYEASEIIPFDNNAHIFEGEWIRRTAPTCQYDGEAYRVCKVCDTTEETKVLPAHSDTWSNEEGMYEIVLEPTCWREGLRKVVCEKCNANGTEVIPVSDNHHWDPKIPAEDEITYVAPTCEEDGYQVCVCRFHQSIEHIEILPATDHSFTKYVSDDNASCGVDGTKTAKCDNCSATSTVTDEGSALTHTEGKWFFTEGNCVNGGKAYKSCFYCNEPMSALQDFAAEAHPNRTTYTVSFTCISDGYIVERCPDCDTIFSTVYPENLKKRHIMEENWTQIKEATCKEEGTERRDCTACTYFETRPVAEKDHVYNIVMPEIPAQCLKDGHTVIRYCIACGLEEAGEVVPAYGHIDKNNDGMCERCYTHFVETDSGEIVECSCFCHNPDGLSGILFKIINFFNQLFGINQTCECGKAHYEGNGLFKDLFG